MFQATTANTNGMWKIFKCRANQTTHPSTPHRVKKNGFHHDMVKIKCFRQQLPTPTEYENF